MKGSCIIAGLILVCLNEFSGASAEEECTNSTGVGEPLVLTPYIKNGMLEKARNLSKVTVLGWTGHSGYFTVNEKCGGNLFFWFIPAKNKSRNAPLFLWLNGGPGASSLLGLFLEMGPFKFSSTGVIKRRKYTWNRNNNILYIDQPVGSGFSFPKNSCLAENATVSTEQLYCAMVQFYQMFPNYQQNKLHLTGESYAGHFIPMLAAYIHNKNKIPGVQVKMNLVGTLIGNANVRLDCYNYANFMYDHGFVDVKLRDDIDKRHRAFVNKIKQGEYVDAFNSWIDIWDLILDQTKLPNFYSVGPYVDDSNYFLDWLETTEVRCKLHVGNVTFLTNNNDVFDTMLADIPQSFAHYVEILLNAKIYSVGFYSGNLDVSCLTASTDCMLERLDWWGADEFRKANRTPWFHDGELAD